MNNLSSKLDSYLTKVQKILGEDWMYQQEGAELSKTCEQLRSRLSKMQREIFDKWIKPMLYLDYEYYTCKNIFAI